MQKDIKLLKQDKINTKMNIENLKPQSKHYKKNLIEVKINQILKIILN